VRKIPKVIIFLLLALNNQYLFTALRDIFPSNLGRDPNINGTIASPSAAPCNVVTPSDTIAPVITILSPNSYTSTGHTVVTVSFVASEPASFTYSLDGGPRVSIAGTSFRVSLNGAGVHDLTVSGTDTSGNVGNSNPLVFTSFVGDLNADGIIDIVDVVIVAAHFGLTSASPSYSLQSDVNEDGKIDIVDLVLVASNVGKSFNSSKVVNEEFSLSSIEPKRNPDALSDGVASDASSVLLHSGEFVTKA